MKEKKYKIVHDRDICIGCSACASICPLYWYMENDGKSVLVGSKQTENGQETSLGSIEEPLTVNYENNLDASEACPVNCIHIYEIDDKKELKLIL